MHFALDDQGRASPVECQGRNAVADLKGELGRCIEAHMFRHLADDAGELPGHHALALPFLDIPELDEDLDPCFRVCAAVEGGKLSGLHLGDVVAHLYGPAFAEEHQRALDFTLEDAQELSQSDVGGVRKPDRCAFDLDVAEHQSYSSIRHFEDHRNMEERQALAAFGALSQETRLRIMRQLVIAGDSGLAAGVIAERVGTSPSTLSFHLKELEGAGLVNSRRESRSIIYTAQYETLSGLIRFLMEDCCSGRPEICEPALASAAECCGLPTQEV